MKGAAISLLIIPIIVLVLAFLPNGIYLSYIETLADGSKQLIESTHMYADIQPLLHGNIGPLISIILIIITFILGIILYFHPSHELLKIMSFALLFSFLASFSQIAFGITSVTVIGLIIIVLIGIETIVCYFFYKH